MSLQSRYLLVLRLQLVRLKIAGDAFVLHEIVTEWRDSHDWAHDRNYWHQSADHNIYVAHFNSRIDLD